MLTHPGTLRVSVTRKVPKGLDDALEVATHCNIKVASKSEEIISSFGTNHGSLRRVPFAKITQEASESDGMASVSVDFELRRLAQHGRRNLVYARVPSGEAWADLQPIVTITEPSGVATQYPIRSKIRTLPVCAVALIDWTEHGPTVWPCFKFEETPHAMIRRLNELTRL